MLGTASPAAPAKPDGSGVEGGAGARAVTLADAPGATPFAILMITELTITINAATPAAK